MPKKNHLKKVLVIGSGPIVIGQAAEFDYSGTQAVRSLQEEGIEVVLINSNPATIMTDQGLADKIYIEPMTKEFVMKVLYLERPDGVIPTLGGQTALNLAMELADEGVFEREGIELLGCDPHTITEAEDRQLFKELLQRIEEPYCSSLTVSNIEEALGFVETETGYPVVIRPAYTLGGSGGGHARNEEELKKYVKSGIQNSPINQILIEKSISGYKEIEYEIMRDSKDNTIVICNMENIDPVGIHTGDSIVVAPSQTLSDKEYQLLRTASLKIVRSLGIEGGCNVQLALDPDSFQYYVIEVNPRVSRSSALASKATGYPIAKIAAKIAIGMSLDEIINPVTKKTYACFEPTLDYVVSKIPRWPFDKFLTANRRLGTQMKATGEVMAIGRSIEESLLKAVRSLEIGSHHLRLDKHIDMNIEQLTNEIDKEDDERLFAVAEIIRRDVKIETVNAQTKIDIFFLAKIKKIIDCEKELALNLNEETLTKAKKLGFTDLAISEFSNKDEIEVRSMREKINLFPVYKMVDTCAAEFESSTPYYYSTYETEDEVLESTKKKIVVLGSGPIRIGQGIEFDYATVHAVMAIREMGMEAIVINSNPETVSTDFDMSDRLYFEPLYREDVLNIIKKEKPEGVIVQFGGQTAINLAEPLAKEGISILGTSLENIDMCEDRKKFEALLRKLDIAQPKGTTATSIDEALVGSKELGFPVIIRPSYVIGGRAMEIVYNEKDLLYYMNNAVEASPEHPILIDRYMVGKELEVDAICDGETVFIPGIMEHIEKAGVHSGDSIAVYPPQSVGKEALDEIIQMTTEVASALGTRGLVNIQFILYKNKPYILEVNPRSSRTVPFLSKVTKVPMAKAATKAILGQSLKEQGYINGLRPNEKMVSVKAPVFSFAKLVDVDIALGPEMKSTGEVMGRDHTFEKALYKSLLAAGIKIPQFGTILVTIADKEKDEAVALMKRFYRLGFQFLATEGTAKALQVAGLPARVVKKIGEGSPNLLDAVRAGQAQLVINTLSKGKDVESDGFRVRRAAVESGIQCLTSLDTTSALISSLENHSHGVESLD